MAADPLFKSKKFPPTLEDWLGKAMFRGWAEDPQAETAGSAEAAGSGVPAEVRAAVAAAEGEGFAKSYVDNARFEPGPPARLVAASSTAAERLRRVAGLLARFEIQVSVRERT